jgi:hypothetical protein
MKKGVIMIVPENPRKLNNIRYLDRTVDIPVELYKSTIGSYFIGYADDLSIRKGTSAWARLYNPTDSGVNLHVNVWTVTSISSVPFRAQFWFNARPPGTPQQLAAVTATNTAIRPRPRPRIILQQASDVVGDPTGGVKAFVRRGQPEETLVEVENGKLIFPPGGSFLVLISFAENPEASGSGRIAFGWWEDKTPGNIAGFQ